MPRCLSALDPDNNEQAALKYESLRRKLIRKFDFEGAADSQMMADEVFNRVARRLTEGEQLNPESPDGYFLQTARFVLSETRRREKVNRLSGLEDLTAGEEPHSNPVVEEEMLRERIRREKALAVIKKCRREMTLEDQRIYDIYEYGQGRDRIERRRLLAEEMNEKIENLRLIVCRIGKKLIRCAEKELARASLKI